MKALIVSVIHQVHGHMVEARSSRQTYAADDAAVNWEGLRPCAACGLHIGKDEHDPCIAGLPCTTHACCGHGLPDEETRRPAIALGEDGKVTVAVDTKVHSWGYVELHDGRRIEFPGTVGGERIRAAVDAALSGQPLPEGFRYAHEHQHDQAGDHDH